MKIRFIIIIMNKPRNCWNYFTVDKNPAVLYVICDVLGKQKKFLLNEIYFSAERFFCVTSNFFDKLSGFSETQFGNV